MCRIIQPRMAEIFGMIRDQLEKKSLVRNLGGGVVLTGGGALLPGASELAQEMFEVPARVGYPRKLGGLTREFQSPAYATAVGLVLFLAEREGAETARKSAAAGPRRSGDGVLDKLRNWMKEFF